MIAVGDIDELRGAAHDEEIEEAGRGRHETDGDQDGSEGNAAKPGCWSALDPTRLHVEDPRQCDYYREASGQRDDDVREHRIGPMDAVRDRLDDLQNCERGYSVPEKGAEDAPALELRNERPRFQSTASRIADATDQGWSSASALRNLTQDS